MKSWLFCLIFMLFAQIFTGAIDLLVYKEGWSDWWRMTDLIYFGGGVLFLKISQWEEYAKI